MAAISLDGAWMLLFGVVVLIVFCVLIVGCLWLVTAFTFGFLWLGFVLCVMRVFGFVVAVLIWVVVLVLVFCYILGVCGLLRGLF